MTDIRNDPEVVDAFRSEVSEMLDALGGLLEHIQVADPSARARDVHAAFRIMHNMKGAATVFGALPIATLAHAVEDALGHLRKVEAGPSADDISLIAQTIPVFEGLAAGTLDDAAVQECIRRIEIACQDRLSPADDASNQEDQSQRSVSRPQVVHQEHLQPATELSGSDAFVRVDIQRLDRLLARVGELLPLQSHFSGYVEELEGILQSLDASLDVTAESRRRVGALLRNYTADSRKFTRSVDDVVEATKRVRMIPLMTQTPHWNRLVREAARALGKHVDLVVDVGDIELDKRVVDSLRDAFFHILRNAVDHGIEPPLMRQTRGKFEHGRISISAHVVGTMVDIDISDDGAGIDAEAVRDQALRAGVIKPEEAETLSWDQTAALIFRPGLSTARAVSTLSGRGVGLDAVQQIVRNLGGSIDIIPPVLGGTTFRIRVPVTIALLRGLLVRTENHPVVLPIEHVVCVRRIRSDAVRRIGTMCIVDSGDEPLRLHWSDAAIRLDKSRKPITLTIVVLTHASMRVGFVVDAVMSEQQFITRALPWNLQSVPGVSGVVFLPDGTVSTVLDVARLYENAETAAITMSTTKPSGPSRILVADDSMSIRTMMRNALESAGYHVFVCADGHEAWETLNTQEVDLLVSDVRMPRVDGLELTRRVRSDARLAHLPVVLVTSLDRKEDLVAGANAGANEYIVKAELNQTKLLESVARLV